MIKLKKGFTLVELLVVIGIIAILAAIVLASLSSAKARGRDARRVGDLKQLQQAAENYFENNSNYPPSANGLTAISVYLTSIPKDPNGSRYGYAASGANPFSANTACDDSPTPCISYCIGVNFETTPAGLAPNASCIAGFNYSIQGP